MEAFKCDLCLKYCDECYRVHLPPVRSYKDLQGDRRVTQICEECWDKLVEWTQENAVKDPDRDE